VSVTTLVFFVDRLFNGGHCCLFLLWLDARIPVLFAASMEFQLGKSAKTSHAIQLEKKVFFLKSGASETALPLFEYFDVRLCFIWAAQAFVQIHFSQYFSVESESQKKATRTFISISAPVFFILSTPFHHAKPSPTSSPWDVAQCATLARDLLGVVYSGYFCGVYRYLAD
jgi:hypothetical protein